VDESITTSVLTQTKDMLVEPQSAAHVPDGVIDVREAVSLNHNRLKLLSRANVLMNRANDGAAPDPQEA
jgi:hypothetical protein